MRTLEQCKLSLKILRIDKQGRIYYFNFVSELHGNVSVKNPVTNNSVDGKFEIQMEKDKILIGITDNNDDTFFNDKAFDNNNPVKLMNIEEFLLDYTDELVK